VEEMDKLTYLIYICIWGSHDTDHGEYYRLRGDTLQPGRKLPKFRMNAMTPSSLPKIWFVLLIVCMHSLFIHFEEESNAVVRNFCSIGTASSKITHELSASRYISHCQKPEQGTVAVCLDTVSNAESPRSPAIVTHILLLAQAPV
jgi:hypothetical protein